MHSDERRLEWLTAREDLRELALLYARGVQEKDIDLLRSLYTSDATDDHGDHFRGTARDYLDWLASTIEHVIHCRHHVGNHLVCIDGDRGEGELHTVACNVVPDGQGGFAEEMRFLRFLDRYRREDGRWFFVHRAVMFDWQSTRPLDPGKVDEIGSRKRDDVLTHRLFDAGPRAAG